MPFILWRLETVPRSHGFVDHNVLHEQSVLHNASPKEKALHEL
jgi:hypothetical protein